MDYKISEKHLEIQMLSHRPHTPHKLHFSQHTGLEKDFGKIISRLIYG